MASTENNYVTHGLRGQVGELFVFKLVNGRTIVAAPPHKPRNEPTEKQQKQRELFQEAAIYGKTVTVTPELKAMYETSVPEGGSVYKVALADFMNAPEIKEVDVTKYVGDPGNTIRIRATDDFMVKMVDVTITSEDGSLIESGEAIKQANGLDWLFTASVKNDSPTGDKIVIRAMDLPGNITTWD